MRGFLLKNAWKDVRRNKFTSGVFCLISILASLAAGNLAWSLWRQYAVSHMTDAKQEYIAEFFVKEKDAEMAGDGMDMAEGSAAVLDEEAIRSLFHNNMSLEPDELEFCSFLNMIVETDAGSSVCNVQGNTKDLTDFHRCNAVEGKEISAIYERKNTCVIKAGGSLDRKGVKTGDTLKINGHTFHVVGVVDYSTYGEIYLPYDTFALMAGNQNRQYQAVLYFESSQQAWNGTGLYGVCDRRGFPADLSFVGDTAQLRKAGSGRDAVSVCGNQFLRADRLEGIAGAETNRDSFLCRRFETYRLPGKSSGIRIAGAACICGGAVHLSGGGRAYFRN